MFWLYEFDCLFAKKPKFKHSEWISNFKKPEQISYAILDTALGIRDHKLFYP